ncbi:MULTISPECIES: LysR substrate-binding domain-containing protein [unclassified Sphingomonas]|nr:MULTISPECIES: LysR substrate-binding domain-containing protein [unclassified Sphingomonas]
MEGELRIVGSRATAEPVRRWAAIFNREHPDVRLSVNLSGSGTVVDAMAEGRADLAPLVRPLKVSERALARGAGIRPRAVTVGIHKEGMWPDQPLYLYLKGDEANFIAVEFVRVALSEEGQAALSGSYAPVPEEIRTNADDVAGSSARASTTPWWGDLRGED